MGLEGLGFRSLGFRSLVWGARTPGFGDRVSRGCRASYALRPKSLDRILGCPWRLRVLLRSGFWDLVSEGLLLGHILLYMCLSVRLFVNLYYMYVL